MSSKLKNKNDAAKTEEDFDVNKDERSEEKAGQYPYYMSYKSRSGHNLIFDDSKGHESVTLQHRGGSAIQMRSDGSLHITAHNSQYTVTFGENRMTISGAHDITVKGDCSLRVYGDYNVTCHKDYNLTVMGNFNMTAKNHNRHIRGNLDTQVKNETKKLEGSSATLARGGIAKVAKGPVSMISRKGSAHFGGADGLNMAVPKEGKITVRNEKGGIDVSAKEGEMHTRIDKDISTASLEGKMNFSSKSGTKFKDQNGGFKVEVQSGDMKMETLGGKAQIKATTGAEIRTASGDAGLSTSGSAYVKGQTVNVKGQTKTETGPESDEMTDLNIDLGDFLQSQFKRVAGAKADQPKEEPEFNTDNWA